MTSIITYVDADGVVISEAEHIARVREKYMKKPPAGYTSEEIKNMGDEDLLAMEYFFNEYFIWHIYMCLFVLHMVFAGINCRLFHTLFNSDSSYQTKNKALTGISPPEPFQNTPVVQLLFSGADFNGCSMRSQTLCPYGHISSSRRSARFPSSMIFHHHSCKLCFL